MKKRNNQVTFKPYSMEQSMLLPLCLDELISEDHLARAGNRAVDETDIEPLLTKCAGGGQVHIIQV
jgi:transposase